VTADEPKDVRPKLVEEGDVTPDLDARIRELLCGSFPANAGVYSETRRWHGSAPAYSLYHEEGGRILAHVGMVVRDVRWGGRSVRVAGIQNLSVHPSLRGEKLGHALVRAGMAEAARRGIPFGLLFCVPGLEAYYGAVGWARLDGPVTMVYEGQTTPIPAKNIAMAVTLGDEPLPPGAIHLEGPDW